MSFPEIARYQLRRRRLLALAAMGTAVAFLKLPQRTARGQAMQVLTILPNGMVVIVEERSTADTVALQLTARVGARDDGDLPGVNVMTSRMTFDGTTRRPTESDLLRAAAQVGGTLVRGTTAEQSFFASVMPANEADVAFDLLSDIVLDPLLSEGSLARQKAIRIQELAQARATPSQLISDLFTAALFAGHPIGATALLTPEDVQAISRDDVLANYRQYWGAANLVLTIAGNIRAADAIARAQRSFGALPMGMAHDRSEQTVPPVRGGQTVRGEAGQQQVTFRLAFPAPPLRHPDRYPLLVISVLMSGFAGALVRELRTVRGIAYTAGPGYSAFTDAGAWFATAGVDPENVETALDVVREEIEKLREAPLDAAEVAARVEQIVGQQVLAAETNAARAGALANEEVLGAPSVEELVRRLREVTAADVLRVARTYLDPARSLLGVVGPRQP